MENCSHIVSSIDVPNNISIEQIKDRMSPMIRDLVFKDNKVEIISSTLCHVER